MTPSSASASPWVFGPNKVEPQVLCVLGAQWGDEGKGKLVDFLCHSADICCRFNGGHNAGHQLVVRGEKRSFHILPCGLLHLHAEGVVGNGVVVHLKQLIKELKQSRGYADDEKLQGGKENAVDENDDSNLPDSVLNRLWLSSRAHLLFDLHGAVDALEENHKAAEGSAIGTTLRGVGPCYSTKVARIGIRVGELLDWPAFEQSYRRLAAELRHRHGELGVDEEEELRRHRVYARVFGPRITDTPYYLHDALVSGKKLLLEGANAALLDIDMGTYPFVTSSNTTAANACLGLGLPPKRLDLVVGVVKAYATRVGGGPMPTELDDALGDRLRSQGGEYGVTTGRPRRCGWLDIPMLRHAQRINGFDALCLTKLDVLKGIHPLRICVAYKSKSSGKSLPQNGYPATVAEFCDVEPVYEQLEGWNENVGGCRTLEALPQAALAYMRRIEELLHVPFWWAGVGADRYDIIVCS